MLVPFGDWQEEAIPRAAGSYVLHLTLPTALSLTVGRLGRFDFLEGEYFYLGSACGAGGLRARLRHHAVSTAPAHWHLDFLRPHVIWRGGWWAADPCTAAPPIECRFSQRLQQMAGAQMIAPGFGAADCRCGCKTHLIAFCAPVSVSIESIQTALTACLSGFVSV